MTVFLSSSTSNSLNIEMMKKIIAMGNKVLLDDETIITNEEELNQYLNQGNSLEVCKDCLGKGKHKQFKNDNEVVIKCETCNGTGYYVKIDNVTDGKVVFSERSLASLNSISSKKDFERMERLYEQADFFIIIPGNNLSHAYFHVYLDEILKHNADKIILLYIPNKSYQYFIDNINNLIILNTIPSHARNSYYKFTNVDDLENLIDNGYRRRGV